MQELQQAEVIAVSQITAEGRTTIPQDVRAALHLSGGDFIAWEVGPDGAVTVRRVQPVNLGYLRAIEGAFAEWSGPADEEAYREL